MATAKLTPINDDQLIEALRAGHVSRFGVEPSNNRLGMAFAQTALETGRGQLLRDYNLGNIKCAKEGPGCAHRPWIKEKVNTFRAYGSAMLGASDYWRLLAKKYPSVLERFDAGDPAGAAHELRRLGYYEAPEAAYATTMGRIFRSYLRKHPGQALPVVAPASGAEIVALVVLVAAVWSLARADS